ncbi:AAA family ATPase [Methylovulum psychrotolerans]|uniref:AAA family ATPase n=1 Tax=Methylovulum psychrotolerans TaxID=1704499 RepID=UPI001BFF8B60|nr:AAA family ATPase [Methylovulum psychrotolerans]MBT9097613.1 AAA family ATPase [Methylovulum psychrotolerans]
MTNPYRVEALALHQVGVFDDVAIDFKPIAVADKAEIHLFTGPNGCGKSTLLYALAEIFDTVNYNINNGLIQRRYRGAESRVDFLFNGRAGQYGVPHTDSNNSSRYGKCHILYSDSTKDCFFGSESPDTGLIQYKQMTGDFQSHNPHPLSPAKFKHVAFAYSGQRTLRDTQLPGIQEITNSPFEEALSFDGSVRPQILLQWIANNRTQSALAKADKDDKAAQSYDQALNRITTLIHDICGLEVEFRLERSPLAVTVKVNGDTIRFDGLPDGLKSIISWVADLSLRLEAIPWQTPGDPFAQPIILFLDEVDIHLHPKWQRRILPAIQTLLPNAQVFVSTHSPFVVGSVENAWVYRLPEAGQGNGSIEGVPSGAGKSYRLILDEVFGIDDEFDVATEALFDEFYRLRESFLQQPHSPQALLETAAKLAARGEEAALIVNRELRQIARLSGQELGLA